MSSHQQAISDQIHGISQTGRTGLGHTIGQQRRPASDSAPQNDFASTDNGDDFAPKNRRPPGGFHGGGGGGGGGYSGGGSGGGGPIDYGSMNAEARHSSRGGWGGGGRGRGGHDGRGGRGGRGGGFQRHYQGNVNVNTGNQDYDAVAAFYNSNRQTTSIKQRTQSPIYNLKNLNNWIKAVLIAEYCALALAGTNGAGGLRVLDLCGGKGGDLRKFTDLPALSLYVLADIAGASVASAIDRLNQLRRERANRIGNFDTLFFAGNLSNERLHLYMAPRVRFSLVSCQFAFHYCFQTESAARRMLENAADRLDAGGFFIGTMPDARVLVQRLRASRRGRFGNSCYEVCFDDTRPEREAGNNDRGARNYFVRSHPAADGSSGSGAAAGGDDEGGEDGAARSRGGDDGHEDDEEGGDAADREYWSVRTFPASAPFGIRYFFTLIDAVQGVPEYLVHFPTLCALAAEYGLQPVLHENLQSFFARKARSTLATGSLRGGEGPESGIELLNKIRVMEGTHGHFPPDQWESAGVYCAFAFQKTGGGAEAQTGSVAAPPGVGGSDVPVRGGFVPRSSAQYKPPPRESYGDYEPGPVSRAQVISLPPQQEQQQSA
jgi:SAM-dependent methyltransferase